MKIICERCKYRLVVGDESIENISKIYFETNGESFPKLLITLEFCPENFELVFQND